MLPPSQAIALREITTDRNGRTIAWAYRNEQSVGQTLVSEGYAVVYDRYLDGCSENESEYLAAEEQAKARRLHYWSQEAIVLPWDFRWGRGWTKQECNGRVNREFDEARGYVEQCSLTKSLNSLGE